MAGSGVLNMAFRMPPCKDAHGNECPERSLGCQGTFKRMKEYQEFLNEHDRAARQKERLLSKYQFEMSESVRRYGGCRTPRQICKDIRKREERRLRNAKVKVDAGSR